MGKYINKLREENGFDGTEYNEVVYNMVEGSGYGLMDGGYEIEQVHGEFSEGGRWYNYETNVYKVTEGDDVAYFEVCEEVPATEMQDGGDFSMQFNEVKPQTKTIVVYVPA